MFAHVTELRYWKSERADITTCEDALRADPQRGLFCVADGAGTTLFSNIWADILVEHFVRDPLAGLDPFEMDWWIRQAQKRYRDLAPQANMLNWNARQKASEQGAYSTLATLRFTRSDEQSASAELLVVGDSCVLIAQPDQEKVTSFPLQHPTDFDRAPYCVPALLKNLNRKTLYAKLLEVTLAPGASIILATDAVARWIVSGGASGQESHAWKAFQEVASKQTEDEWRAFIDNCRANQSIVDDDSTVLIIHLLENGQESARLGSGSTPSQATIELRSAEFAQAQAQNNKELLAILYGDGHMLQNAGITLPDDEKIYARSVADAMREVLQAMREAVKAPNFAAKMEPVWHQYADLLLNEPCAETIRKTLASQGVHPKLPSAQPPQAQYAPQPQPPAVQPAFPDPASAHPAAQPPMPGFVPQQMGAQIQPFIGNEPEPARIFAPLPSSLATPPPQVERIQQLLNEGTPQQKVEAFRALAPHQISLSMRDQLQLDIARHLVDALQANNYAQICSAYDEIEAASLRKYFSFTPEDQQRIHAAQDTRAAIKPLRAVLQNDKKSVSVLVDIYQSIRAPQSFLTPEEQRVLEVARSFVYSTLDEQQTIRLNDHSRVRLYDELFFSPYHFAFNAQEQAQIEQERALLHLTYPPLAQINQTIIDGAQFFALYITMPLHARTQIRQLLDLLTRERSEAVRYQHNEHIAHWQQIIEPYSLHKATLNELIHQALIEQAISAEPEKSRRALEKEIQKVLDDLFKDIRASLNRDERRLLMPLTEQQWRNALLPYTQHYTFTRHLQSTAPGQTLENWLSERQRSATVLYYQRPEINAPTTQDQHECWLFKWWFLRQYSIGSQQGEIEHA